MIDCKDRGLILGLIILLALASPVAAFGAGNIASTSKVEGQNCEWRVHFFLLSRLCAAASIADRLSLPRQQQGGTVTLRMRS